MLGTVALKCRSGARAGITFDLRMIEWKDWLLVLSPSRCCVVCCSIYGELMWLYKHKDYIASAPKVTKCLLAKWSLVKAYYELRSWLAAKHMVVRTVEGPSYEEKASKDDEGADMGIICHRSTRLNVLRNIEKVCIQTAGRCWQRKDSQHSSGHVTLKRCSYHVKIQTRTLQLLGC